LNIYLTLTKSNNLHSLSVTLCVFLTLHINSPYFRIMHRNLIQIARQIILEKRLPIAKHAKRVWCLGCLKTHGCWVVYISQLLKCHIFCHYSANATFLEHLSNFSGNRKHIIFLTIAERGSVNITKFNIKFWKNISLLVSFTEVCMNTIESFSHSTVLIFYSATLFSNLHCYWFHTRQSGRQKAALHSSWRFHLNLATEK